MKPLRTAQARTIHTIIMQSGDAALIEKYEAALKAQAEMRQGMYAQDSAWHGTPVNDNVRQELDNRFGTSDLYNRNLLSHDGSHIELRVLAGALPDKLVDPYFQFDPQARAQEAGIDYEQFKQDLKAAFKGTVGRPGAADFGILLDANIDKNFHQYSTVLGLGMLRHPYDKETVDRLSAKGNLDEDFQVRVNQGQQVHDKGLDAKDVFLVTPEFSPLSVRTMAQILNFQGASHYLAAGKQR